MRTLWIIVFIFVAAVLLSGCVTTGGNASFKAVCDATIGPIRYNTTVLKSRRHAGPDLALDLKAHNQVGRDLRCPNY